MSDDLTCPEIVSSQQRYSYFVADMIRERAEESEDLSTSSAFWYLLMGPTGVYFVTNYFGHVGVPGQS